MTSSHVQYSIEIADCYELGKNSVPLPSSIYMHECFGDHAMVGRTGHPNFIVKSA